jgi:CRISPR-associated endonuclease/helicase Cas3
MSDTGFDELFECATGELPYPWQRALATREEPAKAIVAPTGTGKTEAVLLDWLWRRRFQPAPELRSATPRRLVLALPVRVLVEQTRARIEAALLRLRESGRLDTPIATHVLMGGAADDSWTLDPSADAVLVGTIDMLLSRALNRGFGRSRSRWPIDFGLLGSDCAWVLDEVQLMDAAVATSAQLEAFRRDLGSAAPVRTVWMSATLSPAWLATRDHHEPCGEEIASLLPNDREGPLASRLDAPKQLVREPVDPERAADVADAVVREHAAQAPTTGAPRLTIAMCNTVDRATKLFEALGKKVAPETELVLLHSRFRPPDRARLVARLSEEPPPGGRIVVSTQVIEAGVDLDGGSLITEIAPWASLVQRAGRLNRAGRRPEARLVWLDPGEEWLQKHASPYEADALRAARRALERMSGGSFSPSALEQFLSAGPARVQELLDRRPDAVLLRRPDLIDLFDTDPTLDGDDPDVGRFIRASEDLDVGLAWRDVGTAGPGVGDLLPQHAEVCPVPISQAKAIVGLERVWRWDYTRRRWQPLTRERDLRPGDVLVVDAGAGGYDPERGWTGKRGPYVGPIELHDPTADAAEGDADDPESAEPEGRWLSLAEHTEHVVAEVERLLERLALPHEWGEALRLAARVHDAGKAHAEFQARLARWAGGEPDQPGVYAKAPEKVKWRPRQTFRHELASALLLLDRNRWDRSVDLAAYLVAAHHGKLRLAPRLSEDDHDPERPRCLGIRQGDEIPEVELGGGVRLGPLTVDLSLLRLGSLDGATWIERALDLRDRLGPFVLAYLEALLRAADQRASRLEVETRT